MKKLFLVAMIVMIFCALAACDLLDNLPFGGSEDPPPSHTTQPQDDDDDDDEDDGDIDQPIEPEVTPRQALESLYAQCLRLDQSDYTPESFAQFAIAVSDAAALLADDDADDGQFLLMRLRLNAHYRALVPIDPIDPIDPDPVDPDLVTAELQALVDEYQQLDADEYSANSLVALQSVLDDALELLALPSPTQTAVEIMVERLLGAYEGLVPVNKKPLRALYDLYVQVPRGDYSAESFGAFSAGLAQALVVLNNAQTQQQVNDALANIQGLYAGLTVLDKAALVSLFDANKDIPAGQYTPSSYQAYTQALAAAQAALNDPDASQSQIDSAHSMLSGALKKLTIVGAEDEQAFRELYLTHYQEIAEIRIDTGNAPIPDKENYVPATIAVTGSSQYNVAPFSAGIRLRGNSTLGLPKKAYRFKSDKKISLFGFDAVKNWTLLANYNDKSNMRNYLVSMLGRSMTSMDFNVNAIFVDVYVNNEYRGLYTMQDQIEAKPSRADVEGFTVDANGKLTDVGFLLELDSRAGQNGEKDGIDYFRTAWGPAYTFKYPKYGDDGFEDLEFFKSVVKFIKDYVDRATSAAMNINNGNNYNTWKSLCDEDSFVDFWIAMEWSGNQDGDASAFCQRALGGKLKMGPLWDFDLAFGNGSVSYNQWKAATGPTWLKLLLKRPEFYEKFRARFLELCDTNIAYTINAIDIIAPAIRAAAVRNFDIWNKGTNPDTEVQKLKNEINQRTAWMKEQLEQRNL